MGLRKSVVSDAIIGIVFPPSYGAMDTEGLDETKKNYHNETSLYNGYLFYDSLPGA
jgi:hypothetical protein